MSRQQAINWKRHRKMVSQLWIVSSLYLGFWLPSTITLLIEITILPSFMIDQLEKLMNVIGVVTFRRDAGQKETMAPAR
ncbi:unnamed protein product [Adineta steineri]|uniref:Uncharacterized protein n=1 Tax=Adineta steineri TaxID=433720 RepID=A0A816E8Z0_9BILA|nr:unnamed protein product [Adineta steineri]CAF1644499.1 unnamed protein product [Adineta steineri]